MTSLRITILSLVLVSSLSFADTEQWWNEFSAKTAYQDYSLNFASEQKTDLTGDGLFMLNGKFSVSRSVAEGLDLGVEFRHESKGAEGDFSSEEWRVAPFAKKKLSINGVKTAWRLKLENRWKNDDYGLRARLRGKVSEVYGDYKAYASYEYFYKLSDGEKDKNRVAIGAERQLTQDWKGDLYLLRESGSSVAWVIGTKFKYKF
ncbi:hypothetical protein HMF8227_00782 [Saliniradius amylolyticus]|uniref:Uncharacterized protein n=1 Tax=Saliniradius amylolyticus TaxID=2183582 RepID=A0A2S2E0W2_9ALTE|nr:DUF2490 domain-containing protein [Saliniradius amylolyticus]AWL11278.1 hypothetical protein HMF8227_00782 [Saliniradius amylolyticus]